MSKMYINDAGEVVVVLSNGTEIVAGPAEQEEPEVTVVAS